MAHFAFICVPTSGHIDPMAALARELVARGHVATFIHHSDVGPIVERLGLDFHAVASPDIPAGSLTEALDNASKVKGMRGIGTLIRDFARGSTLLCEELPSVLRALSIDAIVCDWIEPAGGLVARHMGLPYVSVANALPLNWEAGIPSPFVGWSYGETRWHRYRNIAAQYVALRAQKPIHDVIQRYATRWNLASTSTVEQCASRYAQIAQLTPSLDYPRRSLIGCFHYCGPLRDPPTADGMMSTRRQSGRAFASLGSLQGHRIDLFERIAGAAAEAGLHVTIAHGGRLAATDAMRLSRRATVHDFVSYDRMFQETDLAILHCGMNGVLDALARGVPIVAIPLAYEQGAIAMRVRRAGVGVICRSGISQTRLAQAIREVSTDPRYAAAAAKLRDEIRAAGGVRRAADIVEHVANTGHPCLNAAGLSRHRNRATSAPGPNDSRQRG